MDLFGAARRAQRTVPGSRIVAPNRVKVLTVAAATVMAFRAKKLLGAVSEQIAPGDDRAAFDRSRPTSLEKLFD